MRLLMILVFVLPMTVWAGEHVEGVASVVDGDTIRIQEHRIRLWGIDAPERRTRTGEAARLWLMKLLGRKRVRCVQKDVDRYKRIVAQCFVGKADIARQLVRAGHARDWAKYSGGYYAR